MSTRRTALTFSLLTWVMTVPVAHADKLVLKGGAVLEGEVVNDGDKVVISVQSGQLSFPRSEVERVEKSESEQARFEHKLKVAEGDGVAGLMKLADRLRDQGDRARERDVLRRVIEREPNHEAARVRLGYVKSEAGWLTDDESKQKQGYVRYEGNWVTQREKLELEKLAAEKRALSFERDKAELELATARANADAKRAEADRARVEASAYAEAERRRQEDLANQPAFFFVPGFGYGCRGQSCAGVTKPSYQGGKPFINGARHPSDQSFAIPGARDPRSYFP